MLWLIRCLWAVGITGAVVLPIILTVWLIRRLLVVSRKVGEAVEVLSPANGHPGSPPIPLPPRFAPASGWQLARAQRRFIKNERRVRKMQRLQRAHRNWFEHGLVFTKPTELQ